MDLETTQELEVDQERYEKEADLVAEYIDLMLRAEENEMKRNLRVTERFRDACRNDLSPGHPKAINASRAVTNLENALRGIKKAKAFLREDQEELDAIGRLNGNHGTPNVLQ